jgi:uncharacterized protein YbjQ (UPF0145 family)
VIPGWSWTPDQLAQPTSAQLAGDHLPPSARWRIAAQRRSGTFTSGLSVEEFAALRTIGFEPVGQVMGATVYRIGWTYASCGYGGRPLGRPSGPAPVVEQAISALVLERVRHTALYRLLTECRELGGDGVVGVRLTVGPFFDQGLEFMATGTAVRGAATWPGERFTSDLSGQDFVKLVRGGWRPVALVMGVGIATRHDDWQQWSQRRSWSNQELTGLTGLVQAARSAARTRLEADVRRHGGHGVVLRDNLLNVFKVDCRYRRHAHDHVADAFMFGTALVPMPTAPATATEATPLTMLRLNRGPSWRTR